MTSYGGEHKNPRRIDELCGERIMKISSGAQHCAFLSRDGKLWTMGDSSCGQTGYGGSKCLGRPRLMRSVLDRAIVDVECGYFHTGFLSGSQEVFLCGWNYYKQCGVLDERDAIREPIILEELSGLGVCRLAFGSLHSLAVNERGLTFGWGDSWFGQQAMKSTKRLGRSVPKPIESLYHQDVRKIECGDFHAIALCYPRDRGAIRSCGGITGQCVVSWGRNGSSGRLGLGTDVDVVMEPSVVVIDGLDGNDDIVDVAAGDFHSAAISRFGRLFTWGSGESGCLGHGTSDFNELAPRCVDSLLDIGRVIHVSCGGKHTVVVMEDGRVFSWGDNMYGKLGLGDDKDRMEPVWIESLSEEKIIQVSTGLWHTLFLTEKGDVFLSGKLFDAKKGCGIRCKS
eukprot:TRINITY_DN45980_c0_g2_i1.p1 TRINITY_DN45980_c0_g2~~TRINITY_DN45980_c0_g2_i1.p1  ORF type:complete len:397 (-),score=85.40 TRINITY_DN45980_c0_g2_i1:85-1275(-)